MDKRVLSIKRRLAKGEILDAIDASFTVDKIANNFFSELVVLKDQFKQLEKDLNSGIIEVSEYNRNRNRIVNSILSILDEPGNNEGIADEFNEIENKEEFQSQVTSYIRSDKLSKAISLMRLWVQKEQIPNLENELSFIGNEYSQLSNSYRLGITDNEQFRSRKSVLIQSLLSILNIIISGDIRLIEKKEEEKRIERTAASFVQDSITELSKRERSLKRQAFIWYVLGIISLIGGVIVGIYFSTVDNLEFNNNLRMVYIVVRNILIITLLIIVSRYCLNLGKTYMNESLKNADRIHAISFGKFFLQVYGSEIRQDDLKDIFKDWNMTQESPFLKIDSNEIDPKIIESISKILETIKK
jgi:hypothetical protein